MQNNESVELTAKQRAYEELAYSAQCERDNRYSVDEDDAMLGFDVVGAIAD